MLTLETNDTLPNGAQVILASKDTVLAWRSKENTTEYITWNYMTSGNEIDCYWGHYFTDSVAAIKDYNKRSRRLS